MAGRLLCMLALHDTDLRVMVDILPIQIQPEITASNLNVAVVCSRYNSWATKPMLAAAIERFTRLGGQDDRLLIAHVAGAWELTSIVRSMIERGDMDAVVALGVVIRGETSHYEYICQGVTAGITDLAILTGIPIGFGVLTCETRAQVEARAGGPIGNKGAEAMSAAIESAVTSIAIGDLPYMIDAMETHNSDASDDGTIGGGHE